MRRRGFSCAAPHRVQSLILLSITANVVGGLPSLRQIGWWLTAAKPVGERGQIAGRLSANYTADWLTEPNTATRPSTASTPHCWPPSSGDYVYFDSDLQRMQAWEMFKRRDGDCVYPGGQACQVGAVVSHRLSDARLRIMADAVGRERIFIVHGTSDRLLSVENERHLFDVMKPADGFVLGGVGHSS